MKLTGNYLLAFAALGYRTVEHLTESNVSGTSLAPLMLSTSRLIVNPHFEFDDLPAIYTKFGRSMVND
ncbi:MAG: hypothetical protein KAZ26_21725 [Caldilineaceae bacterium]|nr:hypothetical protein [Caldilineaceae bacterium]